MEYVILGAPENITTEDAKKLLHKIRLKYHPDKNPNATQREKDTRLSIDVRINPVDEFKDGYVGTGMTKAEFKPGGKFGYN